MQIKHYRRTELWPWERGLLLLEGRENECEWEFIERSGRLQDAGCTPLWVETRNGITSAAFARPGTRQALQGDLFR